MIVKDIMNKNAVTSKSDATIKDVSKIMSSHHIGSLVVVENEKIVGIITSGNIIKAIASGKNPDLTTVEELMTKKVITIEPDKDIKEAVDLMIQHKIKKLPIVQNGKLVGIVTASDIMVVEPKLIEGIANLISLRLPGYHGG